MIKRFLAVLITLGTALPTHAATPPAPRRTGRYIIKLKELPPPPRLLKIEDRIEAAGGERVAGGRRVPYVLVEPKKPHRFVLPRALRSVVAYVEPEIVMYAVGAPAEEPVEVMRAQPFGPTREIGEAKRRARNGGNIHLPATGNREDGRVTRQAEAGSVPNDVLWPYQWGMQDSGFGVRLPTARHYTKGAGVTVAIVDSGVRTNLSDLAGTSFLPHYNAISARPGGTDDNGHGSHVAGTIAQTTDNSAGCAGVAPGAKILPIKALDANGQGSNFTIASGIRYATDRGAQIINLSIGGAPSQTLKDAVLYAHARGVLLVASAGNSGQAQLTYPAAYPECLSVGAIESSGRRAAFSQYGRGLSIVAPGDDILQQTHQRGRVGYYYFSGTSMAAPMVSGVAALIKSLRPQMTLPELRAMLLATATDLGPRGADTEYGAGLVNAGLACQRAAGGVSPPPKPPTPMPPNPTPPGPDPGSDPLQTEVVRLVNVARAQEGLAGVTVHAQLTAAAHAHATDMNARGVLSHTGSDGSNPGQRMSRAGYPWRTYGEVIASGYSSAQAVVDAWLRSPGHRNILLGPQFKEIGVDKEGIYWCGVFGAR